MLDSRDAAYSVPYETEFLIIYERTELLVQ